MIAPSVRVPWSPTSRVRQKAVQNCAEMSSEELYTMAEMACRSDRGRGGERAFTSRRVRKWTSWSWAESATTSATGPKARDKPSAEISGNQNRAMCSRDLGHASRMLGWLADSKADCPQEAQVSSVRHGRLRKPSGLDGSVL